MQNHSEEKNRRSRQRSNKMKMKKLLGEGENLFGDIGVELGIGGDWGR